MSALGTVTVFPSSRRYSTSACTMVVAPNSHTFLMWWVRPSIVEKKPVTASRTASRPVTGSALPKRKTTSGVRWVMNLSGLRASMSEKTLATSLAMTGLLREGLVMSSASAAGFEVAQECLRWWGAPEVWWNVPLPSDPAVVDLVDVREPFDPRTPGIRTTCSAGNQNIKPARRRGAVGTGATASVRRLLGSRLAPAQRRAFRRDR